MSSLVIRDLARSRDLDAMACRGIHGGRDWSKGLGPAAQVQVNVSQNIMQLQDVRVAALNNVGVIGADLGPLALNVSPSQKANTVFAL